MPRILTDCPHCRAANVLIGLTARRNEILPYYWNCYGHCDGCGKGVVVIVQCHNTDLSSSNANLRDVSGTTCTVFPTPAAPSVPEHTPENIASFYLQGLRAFNASLWDAAGGMFRKALEASLKKIHPTTDRPTIQKRIDNLPPEIGVTLAMKQWAHAIRVLGNDAMHDEEPFNEDDAKKLKEFTEAFLIYVFTLPERVRKQLPETAAAKPA
ncbi:MAG: DUF4145 domain-containing protein [Rhodospirillaceae bacterium]|nr:DUF4145 domain-containing protein [Rhodospirillaceae bacterium]